VHATTRPPTRDALGRSSDSTRTGGAPARRCPRRRSVL